MGLGHAGAAQAQTADRPNVVLIVTDDVGYGDIGSYGSARRQDAEHRSASPTKGTRLTDFYAAPTLFADARSAHQRPLSAALSNRSSARAAPRASGRAGAASDGTVAAAAAEEQRVSPPALVGKWHLGYKREFSPNAHGFDYFFGFKSGLLDYYQHTDQQRRSTTSTRTTSRRTPTDTRPTSSPSASVKFIEEHAGRPFFLEVAYNAAHWPFQVPDHPSVAPDNARFVQPRTIQPEHPTRLRRPSSSAPIAVSARSSRRSTSRPRSRNTLVIFTNDNGGEWLSRNAPLFHRKDSVWEGGIRVPAIMRWPGQIPAGQDIVAGRHRDGPDCDDSRRRRQSPVPPRRGSRASICYRFSRTGARRLSARCSSEHPAGASPACCAPGDWKLMLDGRPNPMLFNLEETLASATIWQVGAWTSSASCFR